MYEKYEKYTEVQDGIITLETYPDNFEDDEHLVQFKVKIEDFHNYVSRCTDWDFDEFFEKWIWDDLMGVPEDLEKLGILISKTIIDK